MGVLEMARKSIKDRTVNLIDLLSFPITRRGLTPRTSASAGVLFYCYTVTNRPARSFAASGDTPRHRRGVFLLGNKWGTFGAVMYDFLFDFCIFHEGQPQGLKIENVEKWAFIGQFSPRVDLWQWVRLPSSPPTSEHCKTGRPRPVFILQCLTFCLTFRTSVVRRSS